MAFYPLQDKATGAISASPNGCGRSSGVEHNLAKVRVERMARVFLCLIAGVDLPVYFASHLPPDAHKIRTVSCVQHIAAMQP